MSRRCWCRVLCVAFARLHVYAHTQTYTPPLPFFTADSILRALRAVRRVRGMRVLVETIAKSFWQIVNVFVLLAFFFTIFSILGLQLWGTFILLCLWCFAFFSSVPLLFSFLCTS